MFKRDKIIFVYNFSIVCYALVNRCINIYTHGTNWLDNGFRNEL